METIIIDVEVKDVANKLAETTKQINELKAANKSLAKEIKAGNDVNGENSQRLAENQARLKQLEATGKSYTGVIQNTDSAVRKYGDSLIEQRALLTQLRNEYSSLSKAQRESAKGTEMLQNIQALDKEVKTNAQSMGQWQDNVGNYQNALTGLDKILSSLGLNFGNFGGIISGAMVSVESAGNKLATVGNRVNVTGEQANAAGKNIKGGFIGALKSAAAQVVMFGKTLLTTPLGWILVAIAAIVAILGKLKEAFKKSDDAGTRLQQAFSLFQPIITGISAIFEKLANIISKMILGIANLASKIVGALVPAYKEQQKAAEDLVLAQDKLEDTERAYTVNSAKRSVEIAKLNKESRNNSKYTAEEREKMLMKADALEKKELEEKKKIAAEHLRILKAKAKQEADTSDETKSKIADATAAMYKAQEEYYTGTTRMASRQAAAQKEIEAEKKKQHDDEIARYKERQEKRKQALENELFYVRQFEDAVVSAMREGAEKEIKTVELSSRRYIEDLSEKLKEDKTLTARTEEAIKKLIEAKEKETQNAVSKIREAASEERLKAQLSNEEAAQELQSKVIMESMQSNSVMLADYELSKSKEKYEKLKEQREKANNESFASEEERTKKIIELDTQLFEAQKTIKEKTINVDKAIDNAAMEAYKATLEKKLLAIKNSVDVAHSSELTEANQELEVNREKLDALQGMNEEARRAEYNSLDDYTQAVIEANNEVMRSEEKLKNVQLARVEQTADTFDKWSNAISDMFQAVSDDSEQYAKFEKAMAIVNASITLAEAIAKAVMMSTEGDPYTVAIRIAVNVASVTAAIAGVITSIKAATIPDGGSYAQGGIVPGRSYSGDKLTARVNSGEMILTKEQQGNLFKMLNITTVGNNVNYDEITNAVKKGMESAKAPVLEYSEFKRFTKSIQLAENAAKI